MKKQREFDSQIVRSGARIRESVRSLPKGHFQQIKQMFDKQTNSTRKLSTIYERQQKPLSSDLLFRLPVTDDEKLQHSNTRNLESKKSLEERYRDYLAEYQAFRLKLTDELNQHKSMYSPKDHESFLTQSISLPIENYYTQETLSSTASLHEQTSSSSSVPFTKHRQLAMSSAVNYTDSYDSLLSTHLNRTGSSRQYVSSLQHTLTVHANPVLLTTPTTCNVLKRNPPNHSNETYPSGQSSRRLYSSTSLSSTGYDSNSSPSIKSQRNSLATNNSNDLIIHSTCSSSASSSSSDEPHQQQSCKPWMQYESNPFIDNDEAFESSNEPSPLITRTQTQLNETTFVKHRPPKIVRHESVRNSSSSSVFMHEPIVATRPTHASSFVVQTTSFPDKTVEKTDRRIRRWNNVHTDRTEVMNTPIKPRKHLLTSTSSTGFQVMDLTNPVEISSFTPMTEQKQRYSREESSLPMVENPIYAQLPPKKPPRTFEDEPIGKQIDQKMPSSSSSNSNSPTFDLGARSVSCMDLAAGVSNAVLSSGLPPLENEEKRASRRASVLSEKKRKSVLPNDESKTSTTDSQQSVSSVSQPPSNESSKPDVSVRKPTRRAKASRSPTAKTGMKKGVSEPNLTNRSRSKSPFTPRALIDRFRRILPNALSKQSLNQNDSDDSGSSSSENNDHLRTSRLDHVSRVKNVYDTSRTSNHMSNLFIDPNLRSSIKELTHLYEYVVQIIPEQEIGYFSNGNGCISSSNLNRLSQQEPPSSIAFKYPSTASDESVLIDFCFPDLHDFNNNPLFHSKKSSQEYFRFTLTNMHGKRKYGYCSRFFHRGKLNALCMVSPCDLMEIYEKILATTTELFLAYKDDDALKFLEEIYAHRLPNCGDTIDIETSTIGLYTLRCEFDRRKAVIDSITLLSLSTETIIKVFSAILYEQKIIFIGNDLGPLTRLINTFVCLLYPFTWPHTYVPIVPTSMLDVIQAPTPYIVGILRSCELYLSTNDDLIFHDNSEILIVDIDHDRIRSIADYRPNATGTLANASLTHPNNPHFQILPKIFKIELKQEISVLRKPKLSLSLDDCQQRLRDVFMSIFVQSCYNYKDFFSGTFQCEDFVQSKQHTMELFLEWFTRTQIFKIFIQQKFDAHDSQQIPIAFDLACEKYGKTLNKQTPQRITAKAVKRKSATRANKQN